MGKPEEWVLLMCCAQWQVLGLPLWSLHRLNRQKASITLINPIRLTWATVLAAVIPAIGPNSSGEGQGRSSRRLFWSRLKVPQEVEDASITQRASIYKDGSGQRAWPLVSLPWSVKWSRSLLIPTSGYWYALLVIAGCGWMKWPALFPAL